MAHQAGLLAKADLTSGMVGEFPELQGIMGGYYARKEDLPDEVAQAIADHYKPMGPNDTCPTAPVSVAVALADKLDTLVGFFAINEPPTGSRDPYALRRAALGIIRLILENKLSVSLGSMIDAALQGWKKTLPSEVVLSFTTDRFTYALKDQGIRHDIAKAALSGSFAGDDLLKIEARVTALSGLMASADAKSLLAGFRRANNILDIEQKKDGCAYDTAFDDTLLMEAAEQALGQALEHSQSNVRQLVRNGKFQECMAALASLRPPIDAFFEQVLINDPARSDLRENRLKLLAAIVDTFNAVADFSQIEG
jgi:glycyl-tRNA synthetase beta chain